MMKIRINPKEFKLIDFIPALSGLIGKTALVTSFAVVWAAQYQITTENFVFENVRLEMIIGSIITLVAALLFQDTAPSGTLAPLVVLVPTMAAFGVHPFILGISVGLIGIIAIKTKLFHKLIEMSGPVSKTGLTLTIGLSGILLSIKNLYHFFAQNINPFIIILITLTLIYLYLFRRNKVWMIIPASAIISLLLSGAFGILPEKIERITLPLFRPSYWWNEMWGIGFGIDPFTILKTIPFAFFVLLLWAIDTVSITTMLDANYKPGEHKENLQLESSILVASTRNIVGVIFGGSQTSALWRSFLIPLFMVKRPLRPASILLGILGIIAGFTAIPIKLLSFAPLIWSVLLFGIFLPFTVVGFRNMISSKKRIDKTIIIASAVLGIYSSLIFTWVITTLYEVACKYIKVRDLEEL
jgi:hypothetical protein